MIRPNVIPAATPAPWFPRTTLGLNVVKQRDQIYTSVPVRAAAPVQVTPPKPAAQAQEISTIARGSGTCPAGYTRVLGVCKPPGTVPTLPPTTCPTGQTLQNGKCVATVPTTCPTGQTLQNGKCVATVPTTCPTGESVQNGVCAPIVCPTGEELQGSTCVTLPPGACPTGQYPVAGVCSAYPGPPCPGGWVDADGNCVQLNAPAATDGTCPSGFELDSSGNCIATSNVQNPYSLYLPGSETGSDTGETPAATPTTCAAGQFMDSAGNCWPDTFMGWMEASTLITGVPNMEVVGGAAVAAVGLFLVIHAMRGKKR
jgi:hypothetical protein